MTYRFVILISIINGRAQCLPVVVTSVGLLAWDAAVLWLLLLGQELVVAEVSSVVTADASVHTLVAACAGVEAVLN